MTGVQTCALPIFDKTNKAYFEELNNEYAKSGEDLKNIYGSLFVPVEDIEKNLKNAELVLAEYNTNNLESFSQQINDIPKKGELIQLAKTLRELKEDYNVARLLSYDDLVEKIKAKNISQLLGIVQDRIRTVNLIESSGEDSGKDILNVAMKNWTFKFESDGSEELKLVADDYRKTEEKAKRVFNRNWDQKDPEWVSLFDEFKRIMQKQHIKEITPEETKENTERISQIIFNVGNLNSRNERFANAFNGDRKYARSFKKVVYDTTGKEPESIRDHQSVYMVMRDSKESVDNEVAKNSAVLENEPYVKKAISRILIQSGKNNQEKMSLAQIKEISNLLTHEYHEEYEGIK